MATAGTPRSKYPWKPSKKQLAKSYEVRLAAQFGDKKSRNRLDNYRRWVKERKMEANQIEWEVDGRKFNRYKMMDYIVIRIAGGESLPQICEQDGMPSMLLVYKWFDNHPDFEKAMRKAEEVRGHLLGEKALDIALKTNRENVNADKLKFEALSKAAARMNNRFQDKQVTQVADEYAGMTEEQIKKRIQKMIEANPELGSAINLPELSVEPRPSLAAPLDVQPEDPE